MLPLKTRIAQREHLAKVNANEVDDAVAKAGVNSDNTPFVGKADFTKPSGQTSGDLDKANLAGLAPADDDGGNGDGTLFPATETKALNKMNKAELLSYIGARNGDTTEATNDVLLDRAKALPETIPTPDPAAQGNGGGTPPGGWGGAAA